MITKQEAFDIIWERAKDKRQARTKPANGGHCRYRMTTPEGDQIACFIGAIMPDDMYDDSMETFNIGSLICGSEENEAFVDIRNLLGVHHKNFYERLQNIHDHQDPGEWEHWLRQVAEDHELTIPGAIA